MKPEIKNSPTEETLEEQVERLQRLGKIQMPPADCEDRRIDEIFERLLDEEENLGLGSREPRIELARIAGEDVSLVLIRAQDALEDAEHLGRIDKMLFIGEVEERLWERYEETSHPDREAVEAQGGADLRILGPGRRR